jgi:hypothetical protein
MRGIDKNAAVQASSALKRNREFISIFHSVLQYTWRISAIPQGISSLLLE